MDIGYIIHWKENWKILRYQVAGHTAAGGMMKQLKHFPKANRK